ncbi:MAG: aconitase X, partial [Beijerinckiaceae bacterium]
SFWGGVDGATGDVIDQSHPLAGRCVSGAILAIPSGRGSCTASGVLIELITNGRAPAAIILCEDELILPLAVMVAEEVFGRGLPVVRIARRDFAALEGQRFAAVGADGVTASDATLPAPIEATVAAGAPAAAGSALSPADLADLAGDNGTARQTAMRVIARISALSGAEKLIDVSRAHLDCCIYTGKSSISIVEHFRDLGGRFAVPTTLNAISTDLRPGCGGVAAPGLTEASRRQTQGFLDMGARPTFTCAPYLLEGAPAPGEQICWAESNAVMFATTVLGARTEKYPDYLDLCVALTGRAPLSGCHVDTNRAARVVIDVDAPAAPDDSFWPLLGHIAGELSPHRIPVLTGLEQTRPTRDDLKAFCAAFATTSAAPMAHIAGVTPEAPDTAAALQGHQPEAQVRIDAHGLAEGWRALNGGVQEIGLVALGNPHLSAEEISAFDRLLAGRNRHEGTEVVVTAARAALEAARAGGNLQRLEAFGVRFVADTCWCMLGKPVTPPRSGAVMTNSGKYAHYGPGLTGGSFRFGSFADCAEAACSGRAAARPPGWLA